MTPLRRPRDSADAVSAIAQAVVAQLGDQHAGLGAADVNGGNEIGRVAGHDNSLVAASPWRMAGLGFFWPDGGVLGPAWGAGFGGFSPALLALAAFAESVALLGKETALFDTGRTPAWRRHGVFAIRVPGLGFARCIVLSDFRRDLWRRFNGAFDSAFTAAFGSGFAGILPFACAWLRGWRAA